MLFSVVDASAAFENRKTREARRCKMLFFFHVSARPRLSHSYDKPVPSRALRYLYIDAVKFRASEAPVDAAHALQKNDLSAMGPHRRILQRMILDFVLCASSFLSLPPLFRRFNFSLPVSRR